MSTRGRVGEPKKRLRDADGWFRGKGGARVARGAPRPNGMEHLDVRGHSFAPRQEHGLPYGSVVWPGGHTTLGGHTTPPGLPIRRSPVAFGSRGASPPPLCGRRRRPKGYRNQVPSQLPSQGGPTRVCTLPRTHFLSNYAVVPSRFFAVLPCTTRKFRFARGGLPPTDPPPTPYTATTSSRPPPKRR